MFAPMLFCISRFHSSYCGECKRPAGLKKDGGAKNGFVADIDARVPPLAKLLRNAELEAAATAGAFESSTGAAGVLPTTNPLLNGGLLSKRSATSPGTCRKTSRPLH